ncbi:MAG: hypothetical protein MMC33_007228 [Icmadophila ericetorum]|nr:hypothetical protein [Icmadophila ericetorum]
MEVWFTDYYDLLVWDFEAGQKFSELYTLIQQTLFKAYRFYTAADFYNPAALVLKTLTRDHDTHHAREIQPGKDERSIYDDIHDKDSRFFLGGVEDFGTDVTQNSPAKQILYSETDALEDQVLFSEENDGEIARNLIPGFSNSISKLEIEGPAWHRFVNDLDTDEDSDGGEGTSDQASEDNCGDEEEDMDEDEDEGEDDHLVREENEKEGSRKLSNGGGQKSQESQRERDEGDKITNMMFELLSKKPIREPTMQELFDEFLERDRSKRFKQAWHKADLEPGALEKYIEVGHLIKDILKYDLGIPSRCTFQLKLLAWLNLHPMEHRHIIRDMKKASAAIGLFRPSEFHESEAGIEAKKSFLLDQERAKFLPDRRRHDSNTCMPKEFWADWDTQDEYKRLAQANIVTRPITARLFKEGILCNIYSLGVSGYAIATMEPGRRPDLYMDYHGFPTHDTKFDAGMQRPSNIYGIFVSHCS